MSNRISAVDSVRILVFLAVPLLAAVALAAGQEPAVIRVSDAVGDTIDRSERDSFHLFPNVIWFQHATIIELPKSEILADVTLADGDSSRRIFYKLSPSQLERIRYLIDNRGVVETQLKSDSGSVRTLAAFWQAIEDHPLAGPECAPAELPLAHVPPTPSVTAEHRYDLALHGATLGSIAGGCIGAYTGYTLVVPGHHEQTECGTIYIPPVYSVNVPIVLTTSIGVTAAGMAAGYALGGPEDRKPVPAPVPGEGTEYRNGCAAAGVLPAAALGLLAGVILQGTLFGRENSYDLENDTHGLSAIPAVLTGLCISVEVVTICYHIGRSIDRDKARAAEARHGTLRRSER